jgi:hypothetical protein
LQSLSRTSTRLISSKYWHFALNDIVIVGVCDAINHVNGMHFTIKSLIIFIFVFNVRPSTSTHYFYGMANLITLHCRAIFKVCPCMEFARITEFSNCHTKFFMLLLWSYGWNLHLLIAG